MTPPISRDSESCQSKMERLKFFSRKGIHFVPNPGVAEIEKISSNHLRKFTEAVTVANHRIVAKRKLKKTRQIT